MLSLSTVDLLSQLRESSVCTYVNIWMMDGSNTRLGDLFRLLATKRRRLETALGDFETWRPFAQQPSQVSDMWADNKMTPFQTYVECTWECIQYYCFRPS